MKTLYPFILLFFSFLFSSAQNSNPILAMEIERTAVSNYTLPDSSVFYSDTTIFNAKVKISLYDTTGINSVHVRIGRSPNSADVINQTYDFNMYRTTYDILIDAGNYANLLHYYSEVRLERSDESLTDPVTFSR